MLAWLEQFPTIPLLKSGETSIAFSLSMLVTNLVSNYSASKER